MMQKMSRIGASAEELQMECDNLRYQAFLLYAVFQGYLVSNVNCLFERS
jgi:hypothetical protein